ncbi:DUF3592 domain-containing protein [Marimonas arenosa]|nr:DUF3592 domain-containing protein [Marimonas arenosa]
MSNSGSKTKTIAIVGSSLAGFGLLFTVIGVFMLYQATQFAAVAVTTTGTVVDIEIDRSFDSETGSESVTYRPTFEYSAVDGVKRNAKTVAASSSYDYPIGARVQILYNPDDPQTVRVSGFWSVYLLPIVFVAVGVLLIGLGFIVVRFLRNAGDSDGGLEMSDFD